jgi:hypothetical protein
MKTFLQRMAMLARTLTAIARLPVARLRFDAALSPAHVTDTYRRFTRRHPKFPLVRHKSIGATLLDLTLFATPEDYLLRIRGLKGGHYVRRAQARGYRFRYIDRNDYVDDIDSINNALPVRHIPNGRKTSRILKTMPISASSTGAGGWWRTASLGTTAILRCCRACWASATTTASCIS